MKGIKLVAVVMMGLALFIVTFSTTSCSKNDYSIIKTDTIIVHKTDTITKVTTDTVHTGTQDTLLTESMLTANSWQVNYLRGVYRNQVYFYQRGGAGNTVNFDNEYFTFNQDHTGYSYDNAGYRHNIPFWSLTTKHGYVTIVIQYSATPTGPITILTWDYLKYKDGNISYNHFYHDSYTSANYQGEEIRGPK